MKCGRMNPYKRSSRAYRGVRAHRYPASYAIRRVTQHGCIRYDGRTVFISESLAGFDIAVRKTRFGRLSVRFFELDLGLFDLATAPKHHRERLIPAHRIPPRTRTSA